MTYTISFKNVGYAPATHLRLTMSYPGVYLIRTIINQEDENMTLENEGTSVVAFLPRLTPGVSISLNTAIYRNSKDCNGTSDLPLADYTSNTLDYSCSHYQPYSIIATYDQGSNQFNPPLSQSVRFIPYYQFYPLETKVLESLILIALAFLSFGIAFRHKRRSKSKLASDILMDIMKVRNELTSNDKGDPNGIILPLDAWRYILYIMLMHGIKCWFDIIIRSNCRHITGNTVSIIHYIICYR